MFGDQYIGYGYLLRWWAVIYLLIFLGLPLRSSLRAIEHTQTIFWAYLWMTLFSFIITYPAVEYYGLTGVVAGFVLINGIFIATLLHGLSKELR